MERSRFVPTAVIIFIGVIILFALGSGSFKTIDAGEKGVIFRKFGGGVDTENVFSQGFHIIAPWNTLVAYSVRIKEVDLSGIEVLANNGLSIQIDLTLRYSLKGDKVALLHDRIGQNFQNSIVIPEIRSATREVIGKYSPEELYSAKREIIQKEISAKTETALRDKYIVLDAVRIRNVALPSTIRTAIESKLRQEQESLEYDFRIEKERKEAERRKIEAEGIKEYQNIVSQSLSERLLKWQGIEATKELANSENAKVVVVGSGDNGLPLILGGN